MLGIRRRVKKGRKKGVSPFVAGLILLAILIPAVLEGFTRYNPFYSPYVITAYAQSSNNLKVGFSDVRIAGVNVGTVGDIEALPDGTSKITLEIQKHGWPVHEDASMKILQRLFIEGTAYVQLNPGSPSSPVMADDGSAELPINQTAYPVQFGQVLTSLQADTRENLRTLLAEYSINGLKGDGAKAYNRSIPYMAPAYRSTSLANTATLGTRLHDLSDGVLRGQKETFEAFTTDEESLKELITNFNITANAFAREDAALEDDVVALRDVLIAGPPALRSVNNALPSLRAFARDALPGTRSTPAAIDAQIPFLREARRLVSEGELKGLVRDLRAAIPDLTRLNRSQIPLLEQQALFASCTTKVFNPWLETPIPDPDFKQGDGRLVREDIGTALVGLAGESRTGDANSQWFRVTARSGGKTAIGTGEAGDDVLMALPDNTGFRPIPDGRPDYRPDVPCEMQEPPEMDAPGGKLEDADGVDIKNLPSAEELLNGANGEEIRKRAEERMRALFGENPNADGLIDFTPSGDGGN